MRVVFCHNQYQQRSGEDIAFDFASALLREGGHQVLPILRSNLEIKDFTAVEKLLFPLRTIYSREERRRVEAIARDHQPEVAVVQNVFPLLSPSIYLGFAKLRIPIVQMVFNYRLLCVNGLFFTSGNVCERCKRGNYMQGVVRRCYRDSYALSAVYAASLGFHRLMDTWKRCVTLFVAPDRFLKGKLEEGGIPREKIRIVSNPFDIAGREASFERGSYALFVGRLIRAKGIFTLLEASLLLNQLRVVVAGDGEEAEKVRSHEAILKGKAEFVGPVYGPRLQALLADAAFVVVPSEWYDNLPMIVCEAFAAGKPVIASSINGIPEFVKHNENGLLFRPGDSLELASAMQLLFEDRDLHQRLARGARISAETTFSPVQWQARMNSVLEEAIQAYPSNH